MITADNNQRKRSYLLYSFSIIWLTFFSVFLPFPRSTHVAKCRNCRHHLPGTGTEPHREVERLQWRKAPAAAAIVLTHQIQEIIITIRRFDYFCCWALLPLLVLLSFDIVERITTLNHRPLPGHHGAYAWTRPDCNNGRRWDRNSSGRFRAWRTSCFIDGIFIRYDLQRMVVLCVQIIMSFIPGHWKATIVKSGQGR